MVQILNTTGLNYHVEQTIANAEERIILISPYLKLSARIKELIEDKNRMKVDIRIIYGKSELNPKDHEWLVSLPYVRLSFCQNLHAKFYANENQSLICSLNLYDFSQINNHELSELSHRRTLLLSHYKLSTHNVRYVKSRLYIYTVLYQTLTSHVVSLALGLML
ncbi:phospholipase D family protein [Klebsiella pneumoniae]